ncbi:MAG: YIP1 family protein [Bacillota bacterium]|nr:YIP1 family protein [Bacillota bacterium]
MKKLTPAEQVGRRSFLERILSLVVEPAAAFRDIVSRPDLWGPAFLILVTALAALPAGLYVSQYVLQQLPEEARQQLALAGQNLVFLQAAGIFFSTLLSLFLWWFLQALVFSGVGALLGGAASYRQTLSVTGYLYLPTFLSHLFTALALWTTGQYVSPGLALTWPLEKLLTPLGGLLQQITVFSVWWLFLAALGLSVLWQTSRLTAGVAAALLWLAGLGIQYWLSSLTHFSAV